MAVNQSRSLNGELGEGATDGKYKKVLKTDRGGVVEPNLAAERRQLDWYYGINEAPTKIRPDGVLLR